MGGKGTPGRRKLTTNQETSRQSKAAKYGLDDQRTRGGEGKIKSMYNGAWEGAVI
jgi:hypothetical protein